jgi:hypothetical protein
MCRNNALPVQWANNVTYTTISCWHNYEQCAPAAQALIMKVLSVHLLADLLVVAAAAVAAAS